MAEHSKEGGLDETDHIILRLMQENGRISNANLARETGLSPAAMHARLKRLETRGYIQGYTAILDREKMGYDLLCFISVRLQLHQPEEVEHFRSVIRQMSEVMECHHITGEYDYLLKVAFRSRKELEQFVLDKLTPIKGIAHIHTSVVLNELKSTTILPVA